MKESVRKRMTETEPEHEGGNESENTRQMESCGEILDFFMK